MISTVLEIPKEVYGQLHSHLIRPNSNSEEIAFIFAQFENRGNAQAFRYVEHFEVPSDGFASHSEFHVELTDEMKAWVIKRAHDLSVSLVEFHSHTGPWPARFSESDILGFREFVPHVWWRLKGQPYAAIVVARKGFDALAWLKDPNTPQRLDGITIDDQVLLPTGLTPLSRMGTQI